MPKASVLQFNGYTVEDMSFKIVPVNNEQHEFRIRPCFNTELVELDGNNYDVKLSVKISSTEDFPMPFELFTGIVGHFTYCDEESASTDFKDQILKKNTVSILFPFLRQIVATLTSTANVPTLMLPIMNFNDDLPLE